MRQNRLYHTLFILFFIILIIAQLPVYKAFSQTAMENTQPSTSHDFINDMSQSVKCQATEIANDLRHQAKSLFEWTPLGWDMGTLRYAYNWALSLPGRLPDLVKTILEQGRVLGVAGSIIILVFLAAVSYGLMGRKKVMAEAEILAKPFISKLPEEFYPYFQLVLRSVTSALIPLLLLGIFKLIQESIEYQAAWFLLVGRLLGLWSAGALVMSLVAGVIESGIFEIETEYKKSTVRLLRLIVIYIIFGFAVIWSAEAFGMRKDFLALLQFLVYLSITFVTFLFLLRKKLVLSLFPKLPYPSYQRFIKGLHRYYFPAIGLTLASGILWCIGFKHFCILLWTKTWALVGVYIGFSIIYHMLIHRLGKWSEGVDESDETTPELIVSLRTLILYATGIIAALVMMNLLEILEPLERFLSTELFKIGNASMSFWIMIKGALVVLGFYYGARLICAFLDYKIFPTFKIDSGHAYAVNTFFKNFLLGIGALICLDVLGVNFRAILVFAGAIGVGIGLALQNLASNLISGFVIIFAGKIRKGDWLEVSGALGVVTDIHFIATKIRTRDDIEYLIPNNQLLSTTIVNYSLSSPMVRISVPFGVSYSADPHEVVRLITSVAEKEPMATEGRKPEIQFVGYGDNSINFELLVWIDIRRTPPRQVRSRLYFAMFDALKNAGIEIPFPQMDLHIRSGFAPKPLVDEKQE